MADYPTHDGDGNVIVAAANTSGYTPTSRQGSGIYTSRPVTAAGAVVMNSSDQVVVINKIVGEATPVAGPDTSVSDKEYTVVDGKGDADVNNIVITFSNGDTYTLDTPGGSVTFWYDANGLKWRTKCTNF